MFFSPGLHSHNVFLTLPLPFSTSCSPFTSKVFASSSLLYISSCLHTPIITFFSWCELLLFKRSFQRFSLPKVLSRRKEEATHHFYSMRRGRISIFCNLCSLLLLFCVSPLFPASHKQGVANLPKDNVIWSLFSFLSISSLLILLLPNMMQWLFGVFFESCATASFIPNSFSHFERHLWWLRWCIFYIRIMMIRRISGWKDCSSRRSMILSFTQSFCLKAMSSLHHHVILEIDPIVSFSRQDHHPLIHTLSQILDDCEREKWFIATIRGLRSFFCRIPLVFPFFFLYASLLLFR